MHFRHRLSSDLNQTVIAAIGGRLWQFISGPLTVFLIARQFSEVEQGFFYAFSGYLGTQAFFELGLSSVLISFAGHQHAAIESTDAKDSLGARTMLTDLVRKSLRYYAVSSLLFLLITGASGFLFFSRQQVAIPWEGPWCALMLVATLNLAMTPLIAILEGTGSAKTVYRNRFLQAILGSITVWLALLFNFSLWTTVASAAVQLAMQLVLVLGPGRHLLRGDLLRSSEDASIRWRRNVLPMQWRIAVQGIALYLATQALTLVLLETQNVQIAGRWGMTWSILLALQSMAIAWVNAAFPQATRFAANAQFSQLRSYWRQISVASSLLLLTGLVAFALVVSILNTLEISLGSRFIDPLDLLLFGIGMLAYHWAASLGYLVRAQKRESLYWAATLGQIVVAVACWTAGGIGGVRPLCIAFAVANMLVLLPLHLLAYHWDLKQGVDERSGGRHRKHDEKHQEEDRENNRSEPPLLIVPQKIDELAD